MKIIYIKFPAFILLIFLLPFFLFQNAWGKIAQLSEKQIIENWNSFVENAADNRVRGEFPFMKCFETASEKYNIPLPLLLALARGESNFDPAAESSKSCYGIMQILYPDTANDLGIFQKKDLLNPCINIDAGARYLRKLIKRYEGDLYLAVAAYNYGPGNIRKGRVPDGAKWYAEYIFDHLLSVLSQGYIGRNRCMMLSFTYYRTAKYFMENHLKKVLPSVPFEIFKGRTYSYDIYITYKDPKQRAVYLDSYRRKIGLEPLEG